MRARVLSSRSSAVLLAALTTLTATGCSSVDDRGRNAAGVAVRLLTAVADRDGTTACALLAPDTADEVAGSEDKPCPEAVLAQELPAPGTVTGTDVYGQRAQVRLTGDTVFLAVFPDGWRVLAAGCAARPGRPYDCVLKGG